MKEILEKYLNISLKDKLSYSERNIYAGFVYFFKRELQEDHYFKDLKTSKVYVLKYNKDNYDPSITETGKHPDSFKIHIDKCELVHINGFLNNFEKGGSPTEYPLTHKETYDIMLIDKEPSMLDIVKKIQEQLDEVNLNLNKLKRKITE